jgi:Domain of unknown function (DUF6457)
MSEAPGDSDVLGKLASRLSAAGDGTSAVEPIDLAVRAGLLRIARDVAHATERQNAPLAAYLIGRFVQEAMRSGMSQRDAIEQAASVVASIIGETAG